MAACFDQKRPHDPAGRGRVPKRGRGRVPPPPPPPRRDPPAFDSSDEEDDDFTRVCPYCKNLQPVYRICVGCERAHAYYCTNLGCWRMKRVRNFKDARWTCCRCGGYDVETKPLKRIVRPANMDQAFKKIMKERHRRVYHVKDKDMTVTEFMTELRSTHHSI